MFVFKINEDDIDIDKNIGEKFYKALSKSKSYNYLIYIFIHNILLNLGNISDKERIKIAIACDRLNIVKTSIEQLELQYNDKIIKAETDDKHYLIGEKFCILNDLLEIALLENKCDIVCLLLQHDIDLSKFLDSERLKQLYNNETVNIKKKTGTSKN
jgi:hypothetical protein